MSWQATASLGLSIWVTTLPSSPESPPHPAAPIYKQYADATGHAPPLREDAMIFWQSRNRYKSTEIALSVANRYKSLDLPVGVLVIDYNNEAIDGDFATGASAAAGCAGCAVMVVLLLLVLCWWWWWWW